MGEFQLSDLEMAELVAAAARAHIHRRFAASYVHDVRGTMQALFSALELLARSAQSGGNSARIEKAYELARRAMSNHEKSTMDVLSSLAQESSTAAVTDLGGLVVEAAHFLRNDAATKGVKLIGTPAEVFVIAPRTELRTLLVGLIAAAIDATPPGRELHAAASRDGEEAVVTLDSPAGYPEFRERHGARGPDDAAQASDARLPSNDLTFRFAEAFLAAHGGRLSGVTGPDSRGSLRLHYPLSLADTRASATAK
jgi:signal transduction histidine kinase